MKAICSLAAIFAIVSLPLSAEKIKEYGFLNIVNLIPSEAPCQIELADKPLLPKGLKSATETGWFIVPAGQPPIILSHPNHPTHRAKIPIADGLSQVIAIYLEPSESPQSDTQPNPPKIRFALLPGFESKGYGLKIVSTFPNTSRFKFGTNTLELEPLKSTALKSWRGGGFQVHYQGQPIGAIHRDLPRASYYLLLSTDPQGNHRITFANADLQKLPPWMRKDP